MVQYAGHLHRAHTGKEGVLVYDYVDAWVPVLRQVALLIANLATIDPDLTTGSGFSPPSENRGVLGSIPSLAISLLLGDVSRDTRLSASAPV